MKGRTYRYFSGEALFPFGFGLSYADFDYISALTDRTVYSQGENIHLTVELKNTSKVVGTEVVQVYCDYPISGESIPKKSLVAFARIEVLPDSLQSMEIVIPMDNLKLWDSQLNDYQIAKGTYHLFIGSSSQDVQMTKTIEIR